MRRSPRTIERPSRTHIIMENRYVRAYGRYTLHFTPQCTHDARFLAYLIIDWAGDETKIIEFSGVLDLPSFESSEHAAEAAMTAGLHWMSTRNAQQFLAHALARPRASTAIQA
jgi:hypothetical protein